MKRSLLLIVALSVAASAAATDFAGHQVIVPIVGRTAGAFGSQWQTDVIVTNAARSGNPVNALIVFTRNDGSEQLLHAALHPRQSVVLKDVVREHFGHDGGTGWIRVSSVDASAKLTARARIYNIGSAIGQYGQIAQGMPVTKLAKESYLPGLSGVNGNRTNVGVTNPSEQTAELFLSIFDEEGNLRSGFSTAVAPRSLLQLNNVFADHFGIEPFDNATLQITSTEGVYAFASVVRSDSGDGDFITATGATLDEDDAILTPQCESPATLHLAPLPAEGWIVIFHGGTNAAQTAAALAAKYGFTIRTLYEHAFSGFASGRISPAALAALRCEPSVKVIDQNGRALP